MDKVMGYVLGQDRSEGKVHWRVRIKDSLSPFNRMKAIVRNVRGGLPLEPGMSVSFSLATVQRAGTPKLVALNVAPAVAGEQEDRYPVLCASDAGAGPRVSLLWGTNARSRQDLQRFLQEVTGSDERVLAFTMLNPELESLLALTANEDVLHQLETILTTVFRLGEEHGRTP